jgi:hypothetical protein
MRKKVSLPIGKDDNSSETRYIRVRKADLHAAIISVHRDGSTVSMLISKEAIMKRTFLVFLVFLALTGTWSCSSSSGGNGQTTYHVTMTPIHTAWPIVREVSGQWEIVGEGMFKNTGTETVVVSTVALKVFNANGDVLADRSYGPNRFDDMIMIVLRSPNGIYTQISPSTSELKPTDLGFCHVAALAGSSSLPTRAQVTVTFTNGRSETAEVQLYEFDPGQQTLWPARFTGGDWVAVNTAEAYHHWRGIYLLNGAIGNSERFALDIMRVDAQYKLSNPDNSLTKEEYYSWGEDILSAGTGTVVNVRTNLIDQEIGTYDLNEPAGNIVVIRHGPALFSFYGHMMQSSATVSIGDPVSAGQVIGRIGNSGYSTAPHIHFQYMDNMDMMLGKGLPALFWGARVNRLPDATLQAVVGQLPDIRSQGYLLTAGTYTMNGSMPLEYDIVTAP